MSATLRLTREPRGVELRRGQFEIRVEGEDVGSIERHDVVQVPLEACHHTLQLRVGRYSSRDHAFGMADGETVNRRCHGAGGART